MLRRLVLKGFLSGAICFALNDQRVFGQQAENQIGTDWREELDKMLGNAIGAPQETRRAVAELALERVSPVLDAEPSNADAHIMNVAALGTLARTLNRSESVRGRYGSRSGDAVNRMLEVAAGTARAESLAGVWNLEVVRRGGRVGSLLLGASLEAGLAHLETSMALSVDDPVVPFAYAVALLSYSASANADQAAELLDTSIQRAAIGEADDLSHALSSQSDAMLSLLTAGSLTDVETFAKQVM